jgi:hypothetical protein
MKRVSFKGVAIGNVVDIVASNIVMLPVIVYIVMTAGSGSSPEAIAVAVKTSSVFVAASTFLGGLCSILGGYVSARIAKHDEVLNGTLAALLCVALGVYALVKGSGNMWLHVLYVPMSLALGALGGHLRARQTAGIG